MKALLLAAAIAGQIGAPVPASTPVVATSYEPINADGWVSGQGSVHCSGGSMSGWIDVRGDVDVRSSSGASGSISVNGTIFVHGGCQVGGGGFANGSGTLRGSGYLYKNGQPAGSANLSGDIFINQYVSGGYLWLNSQRVSFRGSAD